MKQEEKSKQIIELYQTGLSARQVAAFVGVSKPTVLNRLRQAGIKVRPNRQHFFNEHAFSCFTPESCYWAGFLAADGWVNQARTRVATELAIRDLDHLVKLCAFLQIGPHIIKKRSKRQPWGITGHFCSVCFSSTQMAVQIGQNFNIVPAKSNILEPPLKLPVRYVHHFVRGFFDGDGWVSGTTFGFSSGSRLFLEWIKRTVQNSVTTGDPNIYKRSNSNAFILEFKGTTQTQRIATWLSMEAGDHIRLDRKWR